MKCALLVESWQDAGELKSRVQPPLDPLHRYEQLLHALEREELRLQRDQNLIGCNQSVDDDEVQRWGAVDDDEVVSLLSRFQLVAKDALAADLVDQLVVGARQLDVRGDVVDAHLGGFLDDIHHRCLGVDQQVVDRLLELARRLHVQRQVALRVEIDEQDALTQLRQCGAEVHGGGGLAHTPLLHRHRDRSGQECPESNRRRPGRAFAGLASTIGRGVREPPDRNFARWRPVRADAVIIDIVVVLVLVLAAFVGYQKGVIQPLMAEIFFFGTLLAIFRFHDQYTSEMQKIAHLSPVLSIFAAIILAIVMRFIASSRFAASMGCSGWSSTLRSRSLSCTWPSLCWSCSTTLSSQR